MRGDAHRDAFIGFYRARDEAGRIGFKKWPNSAGNARDENEKPVPNLRSRAGNRLRQRLTISALRIVAIGFPVSEVSASTGHPVRGIRRAVRGREEVRARSGKVSGKLVTTMEVAFAPEVCRRRSRLSAPRGRDSIAQDASALGSGYNKLAQP